MFSYRQNPWNSFLKMVLKFEKGFEEANSLNLPKVDTDMVLNFFSNQTNLFGVESRGKKADK